MSLVPEPIVQNLLTTPPVSGVMSADITSGSLDVSWFTRVSVQVLWSAGSSPVGNVYVQGSNDDSNFENITGANFALSGNSGSQLIELDDCAFAYVRVFYDRTSGDGTMDKIVLCAKVG